eukprot:g17863.t1
MLGVAAPAPSHVLRGTPSETPGRGTTPAASDSLNSARIGEGDGEGQTHPNAAEGTGHDDVESEAKEAASEQANEGDNILNGKVKLPFDLDHPDKLGIDVIRPEDNGGLCGGAAFETKGCVQNDCKGALNNGGSDGKASENVVLKNIRVNGFYYEADRANIGVDIPGNDHGPRFYKEPNGVRASQVAVWVPQSRDGSVTRNILVKNMVVLSVQGDGINLHAGVEDAVVENSYIQNTGDDIFAIWGAKNDSKRVLMKNTVGYRPGVMRPGWYGQCIATYGMQTAYFKNHVCKSPLLTKMTRFPYGEKKQLISVSMLGIYASFSALYKEGSMLKFKNYFFGDLENPAAKHEDDGKGPPDMSRWPISRFWWSETDDRDGVRAPFYKWSDVEKVHFKEKLGVKVHFKEKWDEAAELQFDAWMKEKMTPGWHPLDERAGAVAGYNGGLNLEGAAQAGADRGGRPDSGAGEVPAAKVALRARRRQPEPQRESGPQRSALQQRSGEADVGGPEQGLVSGEDIKEFAAEGKPERSALQKEERVSAQREHGQEHLLQGRNKEGLRSLPQPVHRFEQWSQPIKDRVCNNDSPSMWSCEKQKIYGSADSREYNVYRLKPGTFELPAQFLIPENTYLVGHENPNPELIDVESEAKVAASEQASEGDNVLNGAVKLPFDLDHPDKLRHPDHSKQTLFLATAGAVNYHDPYCMQSNLFHGNANPRVGLVLSSHTGVVDVSYQGIDVIRPSDNGSLCGGAAFETKGCVRHNCKGALNTGGSDGKASENVVLKNIRVNGFHYEADRAKIGKLIPGNDSPPYYTKPNGVRASQIAVWVPESRDGSVSKNILVKNMVVLSLQGDGINFHAGVEGAVLENSYMQNTGDDIFAIWGAKADSKQILMKNTVGYNPGVLRPGWYGQCIATYGIHTAYFKNHVCKSPLLTKVTEFPHGDRKQLISVSMLGMYDSFGAFHKPGSMLKFKNYFFGDLANPAAKHADHGKGPPDMSRSPIDRFWWSDTDDGVRAPFYKWGSVEKWGVKVHFKENWDEATELQFDAWMKEKMSPGWHPLEEKAGKMIATAAGGSGGAGDGTGAQPGGGAGAAAVGAAGSIAGGNPLPGG